MKSRTVWFSMARITEASHREWRKVEALLEREKTWTEDWTLLSLYQVLTEELILPSFPYAANRESRGESVNVWAGIEVEYVT